MATSEVTRELAAFLRSRRERFSPDAAPAGRRARRRTPGLRREEVAELAGVSVDYVVRLEQGRGPRPRSWTRSPSRCASPATSARTSSIWPGGDIEGLVSGLSPLPAMVVNYRFDILAWNREMAGLMLDFGALPDRERNTTWLCVVDERLRDFYRDRERVIREGIADLRAA